MSKKLKDQTERTIENAMQEFSGDMTVLESAIGARIVGHRFGWQALRVIHATRTLRKYEEVLGIKLRDVIPERTDDSRRVNGVRVADTFDKFWQAISSGKLSAKDARQVTVT